MKIVKFMGATKQEVESKKFDIWFGVSLGNRYFTKENIREYLFWCLEKTKESVLVMIADRLYAVKLEALDEYSKLRSFRVSARIGDEKEKEINGIISEFPEEKKKLIKIAKFRDIIGTKYYDYRVEILLDAYESNISFKDFVARVVKEVYANSPHTLTKERIDKLAKYVILELPIYLNGAYYAGKYYQATIYPGLGLIDELIIALHDGTLFPELTKKLKIHNQIAIVEGYVDV